MRSRAWINRQSASRGIARILPARSSFSDARSLREACQNSQERCDDFLDSRLTSTPFSQLNSGFTHYLNEELYDEANKHFKDILETLHVSSPILNKGIPTVNFIPVDRGSSLDYDQQDAEVFVGGPAALYSAAAAAKLGRKVIFINNGAKGIFHGSARVNHTEETQQSEHPMSYNFHALSTYARRAIFPDQSGFDSWHYLRLDAMGPGMFSSFENFRNWVFNITGMAWNVIKNNLPGREAQWYRDLITTKSTPRVMHWLQETLEDPLLFDHGMKHEGIPDGTGPYIFLSKGKTEIAARMKFQKDLESIGIFHQEISKEDMIKYYPNAKNDVLSNELRGFTVAASGLFNPKFNVMLENLIKDCGGQVLQGQVDSVFVNSDGDSCGVKLNDGRTIGTKSLLMSLGHVNYVLGSSPVTRWQSLHGRRNPVSYSVPGVGLSVTGISLSKGSEAPICPITGLSNYHRNVLASKMISEDVRATLWRSTCAGCIGGFFEKSGKLSYETYPTYLKNSNYISKYLFSGNYEDEGVIAATACPRELASDDQPTLYHSGSNLFIWKGWQGLGVERPPSIAFQHMIQMDETVVDEISDATGIPPEILKSNKFATKDMTGRIQKAHRWQLDMKAEKVTSK